MSETFVSKGKDVEEAITNGLNEINANKEEVDIEIVQTGKKGFLSIGSKEAVVKLTKMKNKKEEQTSNEKVSQKKPIEKYENYKKGKMGVSDGDVYIQELGDEDPTLTPGDGVEIYKNGEMITDTVEVNNSDQIKLATQNEEQDTSWEVNMDSSKMEAVLTIQPGYTLTRSIPDIKPAPHIKIQVDEKKTIVNSLDQEQVSQKWADLGIIEGIDQSQVMKAIETKEKGQFKVATGTPPKEGEDGWIEYKVDIEEKMSGPKLKEDGSVDLREIKTIPSLKEGEVIGIIHPPVPGEAGVSITGALVLPKETSPVIVKEGKGITLSEDGIHIMATASGRPQIKGKGLRKQIDLIPELDHYGDVDLSSGNIRFTGNINIHGDVQEAMKVDSIGSVHIYGGVNGAVIEAGEGISIMNNVINSDLSGGKNLTLMTKLGKLLHTISEQLQTMTEAMKQLVQLSGSQAPDIKRLIAALIEKKFQSLPSTVEKYVTTVNNEQKRLDEEWGQLAETLHDIFLSDAPNANHSIPKLVQLCEEIDFLLGMNQLPISSETAISISYALKSNIYCQGDVEISGQGSYHSQIHAEGSLRINGVLRGGEVYAHSGATIKEAGTKSGSPTKIIVSADQMIKLGTVMEGTIIQIGSMLHTFKKEKHDVTAKMKHDEITLS